MKTRCILLISIFSTLYSYSQNVPEQVNIEQNALDYFIKNIRQYEIYYGEFKKFNPDSSSVYIKQKTFPKFSLTPSIFNYKIAAEFFSLKDSSDYYKDLKPDTNAYYLSIPPLKNIKSSDQYKKKHFGKYDIYIVLTSRFNYNDYYFVRLFIDVKEDWFSNDAYIKLDKFGTPVDIKFEYGEN